MTTNKKVTVIYHSADFDGLFCREIARKFLPGAELIGWDFKDKPLAIPADGQIYIMDLPCDRVFGLTFGEEGHQPWLERVIWIDHHKSSIDTHNPTIPGYRIDGVSACRLAWQWFIRHTDGQNDDVMPPKEFYIDRRLSEPLAVRLAGEYDVCDKRDPDAETFQFGLRSEEIGEHSWAMLLSNEVPEPLKGTGMEYTDSSLLAHSFVEKGAILKRYQRRIDAGVMERSFLVEFEGLKFLALNAVRFNSLTFAAKDVPATGHDALLGFYFDGDKFNFSLYHAQHNMGIDLSAIAKRYGGGGHRGACGFILKGHFPRWLHGWKNAPLDANGKRPYLFYYEDAQTCWAPVPDLLENVISTDNLADGETMEIEFKRTDMTPEEFKNIPEI